jgi:hypothetical protein
MTTRSKIPAAVSQAVEAALHGDGTAFDALHRTPELERLARTLYADRVRAGDEPANVSSSQSPRPAQ